MGPWKLAPDTTIALNLIDKMQWDRPSEPLAAPSPPATPEAFRDEVTGQFLQRWELTYGRYSASVPSDGPWIYGGAQA